MELKRLEARKIQFDNNIECYKNKLIKKGETTLYTLLRNDWHDSQLPNGMSIVEFVESLKKEIAEKK